MDEELDKRLTECIIHLQHIYRGMGRLPDEHAAYVSAINTLLDAVDRLRAGARKAPYGKRIVIVE